MRNILLNILLIYGQNKLQIELNYRFYFIEAFTLQDHDINVKRYRINDLIYGKKEIDANTLYTLYVVCIIERIYNDIFTLSLQKLC